MKVMFEDIQRRACGREGFALIAAMLAMVVMSTIAVAALAISNDELRTARAVRESGPAFYSAEAGLRSVWSSWPDSLLEPLLQGDSLVGAMQTLPNGATYRTTIHRWAPTLFGVVAEGRGATAAGGQQWLNLLVTYGDKNKIGRCCAGPALVDGNVSLTDGASSIDGTDQHPPGWRAAGACGSGLENKPGVVIRDAADFYKDAPSNLDGQPGLEQDTTINESTFSAFGPGKTWNDLKAEAGATIGAWGLPEQVYTPAPSYNVDGTCKTTDPNNWGSDNPADPCFDFFRIVMAQAAVAIQGPGYAQGLIILDWDAVASIGTTIHLRNGARFNGILLGKGCIELQGGSVMRGAVFADGNYLAADLCAGNAVLDVKAGGGPGGGTLLWSSCVVERVLDAIALTGYADGTGFEVISTRGFSQLPR